MATIPPVEPGGLRGFPKLLSHRGRGFGYGEATPEAVRAALQSGINYLEFDARVAADGVIYVHHGTRIFTGRYMPNVSAMSEAELTSGHVAKLADLLAVAAATLDNSQKICIDIKDFGFEDQHVALVEQFGLQAQTIFVSWIPQALARLHAIAPSYPLIFSHLNVRFLSFGAELVEAVLAEREIRVLDYVLLGPRAIDRPLRHRVGFQHAIVGRSLPDHYIRLLSASGGGICVPTYSVCDELDSWCTRHSLQQWVFTANHAATYKKLCKRAAVQVIFSDDPLRIARESAPDIA